MKKVKSIYVTPQDLWPGARREDVAAVVQELRKAGISAFSATKLEGGQFGLFELLEVTDRIRSFLPVLIDECITAAEEAKEKHHAAALRQAHAKLKRRRDERAAAQAAVTEAADRLAELMEEGIPQGFSLEARP